MCYYYYCIHTNCFIVKTRILEICRHLIFVLFTPNQKKKKEKTEKNSVALFFFFGFFFSALHTDSGFCFFFCDWKCFEVRSLFLLLNQVLMQLLPKPVRRELSAWLNYQSLVQTVILKACFLLPLIWLFPSFILVLLPFVHLYAFWIGSDKEISAGSF